MPKLSDATRNKLKTVSTATVATALFKRGLRIQMIQDVHPLGPDQPTMQPSEAAASQITGARLPRRPSQKYPASTAGRNSRMNG